MKTLKLLLGLALSCIALSAQSYYTTNNLAASNHVLVSTPHLVSEIILYTTNRNTTLVRLLDGDLTTVTAAWTNYTSYLTNRISSYITSTGVTNTMTNRVLYYQSVPHAAATNTTATMVAIAVPGSNADDTASTPVTFSPDLALFFTKKMTLSNDNAGLNVVVKYTLP